MKRRNPTSAAARCPVCRRTVAIRLDGKLRMHGYDPAIPSRKPCVGGGDPTRPKLAVYRD